MRSIGERIVWSAKEGPAMQDTVLYQYLLSLQSPWTVSRVKLDVQGQRVDGEGRAFGDRDVDVPATICFSRRFSSSIWRSFFTSRTSSPAYFARHL